MSICEYQRVRSSCIQCGGGSTSGRGAGTKLMVAAVSVSISKCGASVESVERSRTRKGNVKGKEKQGKATFVNELETSTAKYFTAKMGLVKT